MPPMTFPFIPEQYPYMAYPPPPYMIPAPYPPYPSVSAQLPKQRLFVICPKTVKKSHNKNLLTL